MIFKVLVYFAHSAGLLVNLRTHRELLGAAVVHVDRDGAKNERGRKRVPRFRSGTLGGGGGGVKWRMIFIIDLMETSGRIVVEAAATSFALLQLMRSWLEELIMNIVIAMASMTRMMI